MKRILTIIASIVLLAIYSNSSMHIVEGENHLIIKKQKEVIRIILDFLKDTLKQP